MVKAAVIFEGSPYDRKGLFNAVQNRIRHLVESGRCSVDAYCIHSWDTSFTRKVRHTPYVAEKQEWVEADGVSYRMLWYDFSIADHLTVEKLHRRPLFFGRFIDRITPLLRGYDIVIAHSFTGALIAHEAKALYGIPYVVTWHGSDVHTHPYRNRLIWNDTRMVMENASCNFFVSKALMKLSERIAPDIRKDVLYNGVSDVFARFSDDRRTVLRQEYGLSEDDRVVAFVGSIVSVKNVYVLQQLFHEIRDGYEGNLRFWMVGDGKLRNDIEPGLMSDEAIDVRFWGNVPADKMPSVMNCIDVMVLPSLNEGLPLVCAEAVRCGANVVGTEVGGIPEVIGSKYSVPLGDGFVSSMADKVVELLNVRPAQHIPDELDWKRTAEMELRYLEDFVRS